MSATPSSSRQSSDPVALSLVLPPELPDIAPNLPPDPEPVADPAAAAPATPPARRPHRRTGSPHADYRLPRLRQRTAAYKPTDLRIRRMFRKLTAAELNLLFVLIHGRRPRSHLLAHLEDVLEEKTADERFEQDDRHRVRGRHDQRLRELLYLALHDRYLVPDNRTLAELVSSYFGANLTAAELYKRGREFILTRTWAHLLTKDAEDRRALIIGFLKELQVDDDRDRPYE